MYRYFVAYVHSHGFGRCQIVRDAPILDINDIASVEHDICAGNGLRAVTVINYQPFPDATEW